MIYTTVIIGGGAAGLMAAAHLQGSTAIIEHNHRIGEKLRITGGGKCNVTNEAVAPRHFRGDQAGVARVLKNYTPDQLRRDLSRAGCRLTKKNAVVPGQYFLSSAEEIITYFEKQTAHTHVFTNESVEKITTSDTFSIITKKRTLHAQNVIIASGGLSYPQLGVSSAGYDIAKRFGHTTTPRAPALTGFTLLPPQKWLTALSGLSLNAEITVDDRAFAGNILCAHRGLTGPAAMNASLYWEKGPLHINFLPHTHLPTLIAKAGNRTISTALPLPKRFVKAFLQETGGADIPLRRCAKEHGEILSLLQNYTFSPAGVLGYRRAEVTRGGVTMDELTPHLESRRVPGLFFAGEVLDVTGQLGGYNLQWAFSSAVTCAQKINEQVSGALQR
ncbi:MAG: NAD(P)/FAD-dependent oxidoreductase [Fibrobacterota bacterium]